MNERITENLVRDQLRKFGYYSEENQRAFASDSGTDSTPAL